MLALSHPEGGQMHDQRSKKDRRPPETREREEKVPIFAEKNQRKYRYERWVKDEKPKN